GWRLRRPLQKWPLSYHRWPRRLPSRCQLLPRSSKSLFPKIGVFRRPIAQSLYSYSPLEEIFAGRQARQNPIHGVAAFFKEVRPGTLILTRYLACSSFNERETFVRANREVPTSILGFDAIVIRDAAG